MKFNPHAPIFFALLIISSRLIALPIGFGINQGDREYLETRSRNFDVYHDKEAAAEGAMTVNALEAAKPIIERWAGKRLRRKLPIVSSAVTSNASFANLIFDTIELQTLAEGGRDLFWHEFAHTIMYEHFHHFLGPAEGIIYLPWVPAWFIEGFAEALTVSTGSDVQASIERYQASRNDWPSFDSLHHLYRSSSSERGYATAGAFVSWLFRRIKANNKPGFLRKFLGKLSSYTTPKYYPWSFNPFSRFMPMDEVLRDFLGKSGEELYEQYKKEAASYWKEHRKGPSLLELPGQPLLLSSLSGFSANMDQAHLIFRHDGQKTRMNLNFDSATGWLENVEPTPYKIPDPSSSNLQIARAGFQVAVASTVEGKTGFFKNRLVLIDSRYKGENAKIKKTLVNLKNSVFGLFEAPDKIVWLEKKGGLNRLCYINKSKLKGRLPVGRSEVICPIKTSLPASLRILGDIKSPYPAIGVFPPSNQDLSLSTEIWLALREETLVGDRYRIIAWDTTKEKSRTVYYSGGGYPLQLAQAGRQLWLLVSEHNRRSLKKIDIQGDCQGTFHLEDYPLQVKGLKDGSVIFGLYRGSFNVLRKIDAKLLKTKSCSYSMPPSSPLLWAMRQDRKVRFGRALLKASTWNEKFDKLEVKKNANQLALASGLDRVNSSRGPNSVTPAKTKSAGWRARPLFAFPWIGAEDVLGTQIGIVSVPLMEHMQNESIRATVLVGVDSRYPNTEVSMISTRFWPTITLGLYRKQTWNGRCIYRVGDELAASTSYYDEKGVRPEISFPWFGWNYNVNLSFGVRAGVLHHYLGVCNLPEGRINEPYAQLTLSRRFGRFSLSYYLKTKFAPEQVNPHYDYNTITSSLNGSVGLPFLRSRFSLGIEGSRIRGKKLPQLRETYQALKTFVPGSGGGYNKNNFPILGSGSLFAIKYGDTQARLKTSYTFPILSRMDTMLWLFYLQSLNFTAFYNYGGAWYQRDEDLSDNFIAAHGYKIDLLFENKGVGFNASLGSGQVLEEDFELYATFGFDAFF
ncbi:MAG: hypothetical protein AB8G05_05170 [Oligoflexales bacterium]